MALARSTGVRRPARPRGAILPFEEIIGTVAIYNGRPNPAVSGRETWMLQRDVVQTFSACILVLPTIRPDPAVSHIHGLGVSRQRGSVIAGLLGRWRGQPITLES